MIRTTKLFVQKNVLEILNAICQQNIFRPLYFDIQEYDPEICNAITISSEGNYQRWNRIFGALPTVTDGFVSFVLILTLCIATYVMLMLFQNLCINDEYLNLHVCRRHYLSNEKVVLHPNFCCLANSFFQNEYWCILSMIIEKKQTNVMCTHFFVFLLVISFLDWMTCPEYISGVTCGSCHLKLPADLLLVQQLYQANKNANIAVVYYWIFPMEVHQWGIGFSSQMASNTESFHVMTLSSRWQASI